MSQHTALVERLTRAVTTPTHGVLGVADELLTVARGRSLRLTWREGSGRFQFESPAAEPFEIPLPKSIMRAILARLAVLCNEHRPNCVTPYGGQGEVGAVRVAFVNTPDEQSLDLAPLATAAASPVGDGLTARTRTPSCSTAPR